MIENLVLSSVRTFKGKLAKSPIAYRLASSAFWSLLGGVASRLFTIVSTILVARIIGKEGFGEFGMVQSTMGVFGILAGFGLGSTATKYVAEFRVANPVRAGNITNLTILISLAGGALMTLSCVGLSPWLAVETLHRPDMTQLLQLGSILLFYSTLNSVLLGVLSGFEAFRSIARINILQGVSAPFIAIPFALWHGVSGVVAAFTINSALGVLLCTVVLRRECGRYSIATRFNSSAGREWPILWKFTLPAILSGLMVTPVTWLTNLMLVKRPGGFGELGLFNAANQWRTIIIFLPGILNSALLPILSSAHSQADKSDFMRAISINLRATWVICLPLTIMVIVFGRPLASLFGKGYSGMTPIMVLLMASCFLATIGGPVGTAITGSGRMWSGMVMNFAWAVILVLSAYFMTPRHGALGLAMSYLIAYSLHTVWTMFYAEYKLAPSLISSQWRLITLTILLLGASITMPFTEFNTIYHGAFLMVLSVMPLIKMASVFNKPAMNTYVLHPPE